MINGTAAGIVAAFAAPTVSGFRDLLAPVVAWAAVWTVGKARPR